MEMTVAETVDTIDKLMPKETILWASFSFCSDKNQLYNLLMGYVVGQEPELTRFKDEEGKTRVKLYAPKEGSRIVVATPYLVEADRLLEKAGLLVLDPLFVSCEGYEGCSKNDAIPEELRGMVKYTASVHFVEEANQKGCLVAIDPCGDTINPEIIKIFKGLGVLVPVPERSVYGGKSDRGFPALDAGAIEDVANTLVKILENGSL